MFPLLRPHDTHATHQDSYLIDVREPDEVIQGSIPSSVNIPLSVLSHSLYVKAEDFKREFGFEKPKRNQEIVFYCRSGARSTTAGDIAKKIGYQRLVSQDLHLTIFSPSIISGCTTTEGLGWNGSKKKDAKQDRRRILPPIIPLRWTIPIVRTQLRLECWMRKHTHHAWFSLKNVDWPRPRQSKIRNSHSRDRPKLEQALIGAVRSPTHSFINPLRGYFD